MKFSIRLISLVVLSLLAHLGQAQEVSRRLSDTVPGLPLQEEIFYWAPQMSEHALFLYLGLNDESVPGLKQAGARLHDRFQQFLYNFQGLNPYQFGTYKRLLRELKEYKQAVLQATLNRWTGSLYPSLIKHMIRELDYHVANLEGIERSMADELRFWNKHSADVALVAEHLLDPSEKQLIQQAQSLAQRFEQAVEDKEEKESLIQLSLKASKELDAYGKRVKIGIQQRKVQSIINPVLLNHEARENQYAMKKLFSKR